MTTKESKQNTEYLPYIAPLLMNTVTLILAQRQTSFQINNFQTHLYQCFSSTTESRINSNGITFKCIFLKCRTKIIQSFLTLFKSSEHSFRLFKILFKSSFCHCIHLHLSSSTSMNVVLNFVV